MGFTAQLTHGLDHFGHAAAIRRVIVAEPAAVGVERQLAAAGNEVPIRYELAAFAFLAEAEILELHHDRDGEAVVDRSVFHVRGLDARFFERTRARPYRARVAEVDL